MMHSFLIMYSPVLNYKESSTTVKATSEKLTNSVLRVTDWGDLSIFSHYAKMSVYYQMSSLFKLPEGFTSRVYSCEEDNNYVFLVSYCGEE